MPLHMLKLSVGSESFEDLAEFQAMRRAQRAAAGEPAENFHRTRFFPRRRAEILDGGSIYWIIKGFVRARQRILRFDELVDDDEQKQCAIVLHPDLIRTELQARRPHQGWRYLQPKDAPADAPLLAGAEAEAAPPPEMAAALKELGLL